MINLVLGTMRSGKSTALIKKFISLQEMGKKAIIIKTIADTRNFFARGIDMLPKYKYSNYLYDEDIKKYECILVDETQFLDISEIQRLIELSKERTVFCYGLNSKAVKGGEASIWESIAYLIPYAHSITKLSANCDCCGEKNATVHFLIGNEFISDDYLVLCLKCSKNRKEKNENRN